MTTATDTSRRPQFTIGDRLRKARTLLGSMDVRTFAEIIGTSKNTVTNYELEKTSPDKMKRVVLRQWALATGVEYEWLVTGDAGQPPTPGAVDSSTASAQAALAQSVERFTRNDEWHGTAEILPFPIAA